MHRYGETACYSHRCNHYKYNERYRQEKRLLRILFFGGGVFGGGLFGGGLFGEDARDGVGIRLEQGDAQAGRNQRAAM